MAIMCGYAVVRFTAVDQDTFSECPRLWLCDSDKFVKWPASKLARKYIMCCRLPEDNWKKHAVNVKIFVATLEEAREMVDTLSSEDENLSCDLLESLQIEIDTDKPSTSRIKTAIPELQMPQILIGSDVYSDLSTELDNLCDIDANPPEPVEEVQVVGASGTPTSDNLGYVISSTCSCNNEHRTTQSMIAALALQIEELSKNGGMATQRSASQRDAIKAMLPIRSIEDMEGLDSYLDTVESKTAFINFISSIGGGSGRDKVYRLFKVMYEDVFALKCSWMGLRGNIRVDHWIAIKIAKEHIIAGEPKFCEKDFESVGAAWFQQAAQRIHRKQKS